MTIGDTLQIVIGVAAIIAAVLVARLVYRLERRDKRSEQERELARTRESDAQRRSELAAREARTVRREQHGDDYRRAIEALDVLQRVFEEVRRGPLNKAELHKLGIDRALDDVKGIGGRVRDLDEPLAAVWSAAAIVRTDFFPGLTEFRYALSADRPENAEMMLAQIHHAVRSGIRQSAAAETGTRAIVAARAAIARDWTGPVEPSERR